VRGRILTNVLAARLLPARRVPSLVDGRPGQG